MKKDTLPLVLIIFLITFFFLGFTMMALFRGSPWMTQMHYGSQNLCSNVGGIWCYWPAYALSMIIQVLLLVVLILGVVWLVKQIQGGKK